MNIPYFKYEWFYELNKEKILIESDKIFSSGRYVAGKYTNDFEEKIATFCNRKYAVSTNSCTDALFFALQSYGISENDEVIVCPFSFIASLDSILRCKATPVFVDIDKDNLMLDTEKIEEAISQKTKAIVFVQLFGNCLPKYKKLKQIAYKYNLALIEDAAQALGSSIDNIPSCSFGNISCTSFDPTKLVSAFGTGGTIFTDNKEQYQFLRKLSNHGLQNGISTMQGYNSKFSELKAALTSMQIENIEQTIERNIKIAKIYSRLLSDLNEIKMVTPPENCKSTFHKFVILAENRDNLAKYLAKSGIETKIHYQYLLSEQTLLEKYNHKKFDLTIATNACKKVLSLPIYPSLKVEEAEYICEKIKEFYGRNN